MTVHQGEKNGLNNNHRRPVVSVISPYTKTANDISRRDVNPWTKPDDDDSWSWDRHSSGTSISWPEEMEEVATKKVIDQWEAVQRTLYDEDDQVTSESLRAECLQWRTQRPHLRILGKGFQSRRTINEPIGDLNVLANVKENGSPSTAEEIIEEHNVGENVSDDSPKELFRKNKRNEVLDMILEFVYAEILASNKDDEFLSQNLETVLRITPAPTYSGRNPLRNHKTANEFVIPLHQKTKLHKTEGRSDCRDVIDFPGRLPDVHKNNCHADKGGKIVVGRGCMMPISARRRRDAKDRTTDSVSVNRERLYTPQLPRNALGTVFTEKIIVSPVPFATSTKESFSTLKSTPIRSMRLSLESPLAQRSARSVNSGFKAASARRAGLLHIPQIHSAWQAPVCPTVWPKNIKLAPIDISRLPSSQRRSLPTSLNQPRKSRNSLSPIPREIIPVSPLAIQEADKTCLEIHGKQIVKQISSINLTNAGWDSSPRGAKKIGKNILNNDER